MKPIEPYLQQIQAAMPEPVHTVQVNLDGQFNDIVILNEAWVFRFPRYAAGVQALEQETRLLRALQGRLPLPIPEPLVERFDPPEPGNAFMGYRMLPGEPLKRSSLEQLRDEQALGRMAGQLAGFLKALHAVAPEALGLQFSTGDTVEWWQSFWQEIQQKLFPAMRADARAHFTEHFESFFQNRSLHSFQPALRHGDFGGSNILWSPTEGKITGVIDFAFCKPGDPAADLASVSTLGEHFFGRIVEAYGQHHTGSQPVGAAFSEPAIKERALVERARFYRGTFALMEALDGLRDGDPEAFRRGMEDYV